MTNDAPRAMSSLSRRMALGGVSAAAAALSLSRLHPAAAQEATPDAMTRMLAMASHPIVGAWLALNPSPLPAIFAADGTTTLGAAPNYLDFATASPRRDHPDADEREILVTSADPDVNRPGVDTRPAFAQAIRIDAPASGV